MQSLKNKLIINTILYGIIVGAIIGIIYFYLFPSYYTNWYLAIWLFFIVIETISIYLLEKMSHTVNDRQMVNGYLLMKTVKIIITLFVIVIYAAIVKDKTLTFKFAIAFIILYISFLAIESSQYLKLERSLKKKKLNDEV